MNDTEIILNVYTNVYTNVVGFDSLAGQTIDFCLYLISKCSTKRS